MEQFEAVVVRREALDEAEINRAYNIFYLFFYFLNSECFVTVGKPPTFIPQICNIPKCCTSNKIRTKSF